jgi:hypothetical protein
LADVDRAAKTVLTEHGYQTRTGSGCGRGITSYEADARELRMDLRLYSDVILEPGMAFSLEPDLDVPGMGTFRHCNTIIVTENGCDVDSRLPRESSGCREPYVPESLRLPRLQSEADHPVAVPILKTASSRNGAASTGTTLSTSGFNPCREEPWRLSVQHSPFGYSHSGPAGASRPAG